MRYELAIKMDVTDAASADESNLINRKVDGTSKFRVRKDGLVYSAATTEYQIEDYGGKGYETAQVSPDYNNTAFATILALIKTSGRGGVIRLRNLTYYLNDEILIEDVSGVEIRGPGGHRSTYQVTAVATAIWQMGMACLWQTDSTKHVIRVKSTGSYVSPKKPSTLRLHNLTIRGEFYIDDASGDFPAATSPAGLMIDASVMWMAGFEIENCLITNIPYGVRTNADSGEDRFGVGYLHVLECGIKRCFWGVWLDAHSCVNTVCRFLNSSIRQNGHRHIAEANNTTMAQGGGIYMWKGNSMTINGCVLESNSTGIHAENIAACDFENNYFESNKTCAINLEGWYNAGTVYPTNCISLRSNYLSETHAGTNGANIVLEYCSDIDASGCKAFLFGSISQSYANIVDEGNNWNIISRVGGLADPLVEGITSADLIDETHRVNVKDKYESKQLWNNTTHFPIWATGAGVNDDWVDSAGTTYTPA